MKKERANLDSVSGGTSFDVDTGDVTFEGGVTVYDGSIKEIRSHRETHRVLDYDDHLVGKSWVI